MRDMLQKGNIGLCPPTDSEMDNLLTNAAYHELSAKAEHLYNFVNLFKASFHRPRDYSGHFVNMVEVHDLTYIDDHPGVTAAEIAKNTARTRGAVSQVLTKLEKNHLIRKEQSPVNASMMLLYTTEIGKQISDAHKSYDVHMLTAMNDVLRQHFSEMEIDCFYRVLRFLSIELSTNQGRGGSVRQNTEST